MIKLQQSFATSDVPNADTATSIMKCSRFDPETIAHLPEQLRMSIRMREIKEEEIIKNVIAGTENINTDDIRNITNQDSFKWSKAYQISQMHNYSKHEQPVVSNTTEEEAFKSAEELIDMEKKAKAKAEKKEAKKKRQKERKKAEKTGCGNKNEDSDTASLNDATTTVSETDKTEIDKDCEDDKSLACSEFDEEIDINAAFVKVSAKRNKNISTNKNSSTKTCKVGSSITSGSIPKFVKPNVNKMNHETAGKFGIQSYQLVLNSNDFDRAIDQLTQAIFLAPNDFRHFLNRSYCYLRLGQYSLALRDARVAKQFAQSIEHIAKAVAREGQALFGLHEYHEAEKCFEETIKLEQGNKWILGELILVRTLQLTSMGFSRTRALKALHQCSTVADAATLLISENIDSSELENNVNESEVDDSDGDEIYFPNDESSSSILLLKLVSTLANESRYFEKLKSEPFSSKVQQYTNYCEKTIKSSSSMESITRRNGVINNGNAHWEVSGGSKSGPTTSKAKINKMIPSDSSSIWVGSIESSITDNKLREKFSKFGQINYIKRFPDKRFAFIDFTSRKAATAALNSVTDIEINGIKLPIKPASGSFTKK